MDHTALRKEVFTWYGAAAYYAQCIEVELIIGRLFLARRRTPQLSDAEWDKINRDKRTMGGLLTLLTSELDLDEGEAALLNTCVEDRNFLAHEYWYRRSGLLATPQGCHTALGELQEMFERLKKGNRVAEGISKFAERSLIDDEAIACHEGVPGHHMQLSVQQQLTGLPKFRLHGLGFNAYTEGWALYAEQLGKEVGFYQDPVSDYGRLSSELFRAVRLVVDTGIHSKGWTRDQVVDFFRKSGVVDEPTVQSETDRYIASPAQALSYKLGQLKFRELRERAQKELGSKFDLRTFHDEMLDGGTLPLDLLDARTDKWIAQQKIKMTL